MLYDGEDVMIALGITALLVIFLTAFAFQVNSLICNVREGVKKAPFSSLLLLRGPATPPPLSSPVGN